MVINDLRKDYYGTDIVDTNYKFYNQIRNGINIKTNLLMNYFIDMSVQGYGWLAS